MVEKVLAVAVLAVCGVMLLRLCLAARARHRFDNAARAVARLPLLAVHRVRAARGGAEGIPRAERPDGHWEGNVYTAKSVQQTSKRPRKPH